jgi:hypothetical protein
MALTDLFEGLRQRGARLELHGEMVRVASGGGLPPDLAAALRAHKPAVIEALRRADRMLLGVRPGGAMPFLALTAAPWQPGHCLSCDAPSTARRCELCVHAATIAAERHMATARGVRP